MDKFIKIGHWFIRAMGLACLLMLITGVSYRNGWLGIDLFMIAIWLWDEYSLWKNGI